MSLTVNHKPTLAGIHINYASNQSKETKKGIIKNMLDRASQI